MLEVSLVIVSDYLLLNKLLRLINMKGFIKVFILTQFINSKMGGSGVRIIADIEYKARTLVI